MLVVDDVDLGRTGNLLEKHRSNVLMRDVHLLYLLIEEARAEPIVRRHNGEVPLENCNTVDLHYRGQVVFLLGEELVSLVHCLTVS